MEISDGMTAHDAPLLAQIEAVARTGERRTTPSADGTMTWHLFGRGEPLVLLHGGMGSWQHWLRNIPVLAERYTLLVPDIPGHMDSALPMPYTPPAVGEILMAGIDQLLGTDATFSAVGFSFGAAIGGEVARLGGSRVGWYVMVSPGGLGLPRGKVEGVERWRHLERVEDRRAVHRQNLAVSMFADPDRVDDLAVLIHARSAEVAKPVSAPISFGGSLQECLPHVRARLAGIWGAQDPASSPFMAERRDYLHRLQPAAPITIIDGASHWLPYETPAPFHAALLDILAR